MSKTGISALLMKISLPLSIRHDQSGFSALAGFWAQTQHCILDDIKVDMQETSWFDADMCAVFGAILYRLGDDLNSIELANLNPEVESALSRNGFLSRYGRERLPDYWGTTISYQHFDAGDNRVFTEYMEREFLQRTEIPSMSPRLRKKFWESLYEIFNNAATHSRTKLGVFSCGQFFPKKNRLDFTVVDLGVGIRENVNADPQRDMTAAEAISWAVQANNTTKTGDIPGGLGLALLCKFISLNDGRIQIVSDQGYWHQKGQEIECLELDNPFPGTVVSIEVNTADTKSYKLASEVKDL